jgi:hypothetical protein
MKDKFKVYIEEKIGKVKIYIKFFLSVIKLPWKNDESAFLADKNVKGVIHIGAHWGGGSFSIYAISKRSAVD